MTQPPEPPNDAELAEFLAQPDRRTPEQLWREEMTSQSPRQAAGAALALGRLVAAEGRPREAAALLRQAADAPVPTISPRALVELVHVLETLDRLPEADQALHDAQAQSDPRSTPEVNLAVAAVHAERGDSERAITVLETIVDARPRRHTREAESAHDLIRATAALRLGNLLKRAGRAVEAIEKWRLALDSNYPAITPVAALHIAEAVLAEDRAEGELPPAVVEELFSVAIDFGHPVATPRAKVGLQHYVEAVRRAKEPDLRALAPAGARPGVALERATAVVARSPGPIKRLPRQAKSLASKHLPGPSQRALIVGAGTGGRYLLRDLPKERYKVIGWVDDDPPSKTIAGLAVLGGIDELRAILADFMPDVVLIAIPTLSGERRSDVVAACLEHDVAIENLPSMFELLRHENIASQLREVRIEETLGVESMRIDRGAGDVVRGRNVMVTGVGGTMGGELARQIAHARARHLALVDISTSALRRVTDDLRVRGFERAFPVVGACDRERAMRRALEAHAPDIVFHAACHSHAPIAEAHPVETMRTNALGALSMARACGEAGVKRFVLIGSDDAGSLRGVYNASRALAEHALAAMQDEYPGTDYVAVRVGNLYRTTSSVVEVFEKQIGVRAPLTLTQPDAQRRFLRVELAAQLLLRTAGMAKAGRLYALDAGQTLRIQDLAERMIRLRGLEPGKDIRTVNIGPRLWEKRVTRPYGPDEHSNPTALAHVLEIQRRPVPAENIRRALEMIKQVVDDENPAEVLNTLATTVPELLDEQLLASHRSLESDAESPELDELLSP